MSKLSNELLMIQLLSNGRKYSIKELSNILEVSERMVRCYKEEIEKSGIIIETIRGIYGGYILKNDYLIPKMKFNDYEYKFLSNIKCSNENKKLLDEILIKVKSMSNCNDTKHIVSSEIKNYYNKMSEDTKIILVNILADNLIYLHDFEVVDKKVIKSISSLLLLFINHNTKTKIKEFDEFSIYEKKVLYSIIIDGIASIYVDNEYLNYSDIGTKYKQKIIQE